MDGHKSVQGTEPPPPPPGSNFIDHRLVPLDSIHRRRLAALGPREEAAHAAKEPGASLLALSRE